MPTSRYEDKKGNRLPSVTQILGQAWAKPALVAWAHSEGLKGRPLNKTRDEAAEAGTAAHELILAHIGGPEPDMSRYSSEAVAKARISNHHVQDWLAAHTFEPLVVEVPLVSDKMGYGGTPDWYGLLDGVPTVLDIKTGRLYPDQFVQMAGYRLLLQGLGHEVESMLLVQAPRTLGKSDRCTTSSRTGKEMIEPYERAWRAALEIYTIKNIIGF